MQQLTCLNNKPAVMGAICTMTGHDRCGDNYTRCYGFQPHVMLGSSPDSLILYMSRSRKDLDGELNQLSLPSPT
jgi:hypothetical protein